VLTPPTARTVGGEECWVGLTHSLSPEFEPGPGAAWLRYRDGKVAGIVLGGTGRGARRCAFSPTRSLTPRRSRRSTRLRRRPPSSAARPGVVRPGSLNTTLVVRRNVGAVRTEHIDRVAKLGRNRLAKHQEELAPSRRESRHGRYEPPDFSGINPKDGPMDQHRVRLRRDLVGENLMSRYGIQGPYVPYRGAK
jgi:hypothetical protein